MVCMVQHRQRGGESCVYVEAKANATQNEKQALLTA